MRHIVFEMPCLLGTSPQGAARTGGLPEALGNYSDANTTSDLDPMHFQEMPKGVLSHLQLTFDLR